MIFLDFSRVTFRRLFSVSLRKKLRIKLAEMSFENDFTKTERGNLYPIVSSDNDVCEIIENGVYSVSNGRMKRLMCGHFPFSEYSFSILKLCGKAGFSFVNSSADVYVDVYITNTESGYDAGFSVNGSPVECGIFIPAEAESVSFGTRGSAVDIYYGVNGHYSLAGTMEIPELDESCVYPFPFKTMFFSEARIFETDRIESYIDNGLALADMKPVRYIDGSTMVSGGKVYFTMSSRLGSGGYQSVISWLPGTCEFRLEGAVFFDIENKGKISGDIASCVLYDKEKDEYLLWMCAFSSGHILGYGRSDSDILHGISIIDITLMSRDDKSAETDFSAFEGDEDPDFYYDAERDRWYLSVCRVRKLNGRNTYSYIKYESGNPFSGYVFFGETANTGETGGMTAVIDGKRYFMCGAEMSETSKYRIYDAETLRLLSEADYDYPDGGFRGWGTLVPVRNGNRRRIFQITFDRVLGSDFNWSYGNLYVFEALENPE